MKQALVKLGLAAALVAPTAAMAGEPVYFHKANVTRESFSEDIAYCSDLAKGVQRPAQPYVYTPNLYAVAVVALLNGFASSRERRNMIDNVLRTCMADKGYRRVEATKGLAKEMDKLPDAARAARLFELAAAAEPVGEVLPQ